MSRTGSTPFKIDAFAQRTGRGSDKRAGRVRLPFHATGGSLRREAGARGLRSTEALSRSGPTPILKTGFVSPADHSGEKEIRLPGFVHAADEVTNEHDVAGPKGLSVQFHAHLLRGAVSFLVVAGDAGRNEVFPRISAPAGLGQHVVDREVVPGSAVLAGIPIPLDDVLPREHDAFVRDTRVLLEPNDARPREANGGGADVFVGHRLHEMHLLQVHQDDGTLNAADSEGAVVLVKNEYVTGHALDGPSSSSLRRTIRR